MENRKGRMIIGIIAIMISVFYAMFSVRESYIYFDSPEKAYEYAKGEETVLIVEGEITDRVIGKKGDIILEKNEKGWRIPFFQVLTHKYEKQVGTVSIYVMRYKFTDEYYMTVMDLEGNPIEIEDNNNSVFYLSEKVNETVSGYYAYLHKVDDNYRIRINGIEVMFSK